MFASIPKNLILKTFALSFIFILSLNCISSHMPGLLFTKTSQHLSSGSTGGVKLQSIPITKSGRSCSVGSWFYLAYFYYGGGGSIHEAMEEGGLQRIATIDRESLSLLAGTYYQECTVVWGD